MGCLQAVQGRSQDGIAESEVTDFHTKQAKVLSEGSAAPREAARTICLSLCVHSTGYLLFSPVCRVHSTPQGG